MTLESLEVTFTVDTGALSFALDGLRARVDALAASVAGAFAGLYNNGLSAGRALGDGLTAGIENRIAQVTSAARRLARAAGSSVRETLDIHSPSRVSRQMGERFGEGLAQGMRGARAMVLGAGRELANAATALSRDLPDQPRALPQGAALSARESDLGDVLARAVAALAGQEKDIVLSVDGLQLGRASAKGINALRRATGVLPLDV